MAESCCPEAVFLISSWGLRGKPPSSGILPRPHPRCWAGYRTPRPGPRRRRNGYAPSRRDRRSYGATCTVRAGCGASTRCASSPTRARPWWPPAHREPRPAGRPSTSKRVPTATGRCVRRRSTRWRPACGSSRTRCGRRPRCCCGSRRRSAPPALRRTAFDLTVDLVVTPDLTSWQWKDEDEYARVRRLGIISDTEHQAVDAAREEVLAMLSERTGAFAQTERWVAWRREPAWPTPCLCAARSGRGERCTEGRLNHWLDSCAQRGTGGGSRTNLFWSQVRDRSSGAGTSSSSMAVWPGRRSATAVRLPRPTPSALHRPWHARRGGPPRTPHPGPVAPHGAAGRSGRPDEPAPTFRQCRAGHRSSFRPAAGAASASG